MGVIYYKEPKLENPVLIASWPGIGNVGLLAVETLNNMVNGEEFAEIEPMEYFYPKKLVIRDGEMKNLEFPTSKFYYKRLKERDLLVFIGEEQPVESGRSYAEGIKAYQMANLVISVATKFGCTKVYTSGAAVSAIHHSHQSRVWAVPNSGELMNEIRTYENTMIMSEIEGREGNGGITGLNGLLLGVARTRGIDAICLMGEIPVYLQGFAVPYPKAAKSVIEVLSGTLGVTGDLTGMDELIARSEVDTENLLDSFPPEIRDQIDKLKTIISRKRASTEPITEDDKKKILEDIDKFFKQEPKGE